MKPNPLSALDISKDWPKFGDLDGRRVNLKDAWATLSYAELASIAVEIPGKGKRWPWKQLEALQGMQLTPGSDGLMPRASLRIVKLDDAKLEAWAFEKHAINLTLDGDEDTLEKQSIRYDAFRRFWAERPKK